MRKLLLVLLAACLASCSKAPEPRPVPEYPSVSELAQMLADGETSSVAVVSALLERADVNSGLNAFIHLDAEGALNRAAELDALREEGETLGPLHGVPLVVKDNIHVAGMPNTGGTPGLASFVPAEHNGTVQTLVDAGAIVLAKTNLHELAFGITSDNGAYGAVANPFNPETFAGGSSGGTASAISAGIAPGGLGTDTGGSVRIPAALTGVVGFRPSTGRYDTNAVTPISHTRDTIGVMARSAVDAALMDAVITGGDIAKAANVSELRLGVPDEYYFDNLDPQLAAVFDQAIETLRRAGVTIVDVSPPDVGELIAASAFPIALYEVLRDLPDYLQTFNTGADFDAIASAAASPDVKGLFAMLGSPEGQIPDEVYASAIDARAALRMSFASYFAENELDAMIFPTTPLPARPIAGSVQTVELNGEQVPTFPTYIRNTDPASIAALPGISLPIGLTADGLPVGLEIDGPEDRDVQVLEIAIALEELFEFGARPR